ncbi:PilZ domain-containing protein [Desulfacinum hydrothermale DSM 13146]|uniref:PilZ domain-containing protein n=1 Tax=Desulfacinum hydrothermale DSM 13146 TaxID=1121390 RepID=A0A1W1XRX5_9BACT|nr:PilZ domain-containing protein [Desulfacinum hydrothermale]SMC26602.1 PilZ domain-containing protein [Desulfacinum hydrothermale DSM 13146]
MDQQVKKVYVAQDGTAIVICEACGRTRKLVNIQENMPGKTVRVRCGCGAHFTILLERRRYYRKRVHLPGYYSKTSAPGEQPMVVKDISLGGLRFETLEEHELKKGDVVLVRFRLDDTARTAINRPVVVRFVGHQVVGAEYFKDDPIDKALGIYLLA